MPSQSLSQSKLPSQSHASPIALPCGGEVSSWWVLLWSGNCRRHRLTNQYLNLPDRSLIGESNCRPLQLYPATPHTVSPSLSLAESKGQVSQGLPMPSRSESVWSRVRITRNSCHTHFLSRLNLYLPGPGWQRRGSCPDPSKIVSSSSSSSQASPSPFTICIFLSRVGIIDDSCLLHRLFHRHPHHLSPPGRDRAPGS